MPNADHIAVLERGAAIWNAWWGEQKETPDLSGAGLRGLDLSGFNLSHTDFRGPTSEGQNSARPNCQAPYGGRHLVSASFENAHLEFRLGDAFI